MAFVVTCLFQPTPFFLLDCLSVPCWFKNLCKLHLQVFGQLNVLSISSHGGLSLDCWFLTCFVLYFCSTGAWTQGLHLEPLHQPFWGVCVCVRWIFLWARVLQTICPCWLLGSILLISASCIPKIAGVSYTWHLLALNVVFWCTVILMLDEVHLTHIFLCT
jgi:hypothetical protein